MRSGRIPSSSPPSSRTRVSARASLAAFSLFAIVIGVIFVIPLMLSKVHGLGTAQIGLVLFPGAISSVIFGPIAGRMADRRGSGASSPSASPSSSPAC